MGNAYINRHTTGAIVRRQPFGGWKGSVFGPGAKAGGPNYVLQLGHWQQADLPAAQAALAPEIATLLALCLAQMPNDGAQTLLRASAASYAWAWRSHFSQEHDPSQIVGEQNIFRYRPGAGILLRVAHIDATALCQVVLAARTCHAHLTVSLPPSATEWAWLQEAGDVQLIYEEEAYLVDRLQAAGGYDRLRMVEPVSLALRRAANAAHVSVIDAPVLANGRLELRHYLREQALAQTMHRYGNLLSAPGKGF